MSLAHDIVAARRSGAELTLPRLSLDEGYGVARDVWALLGSPIGWKIGATNEGGQRFLGIDAPIRGRVYTIVEAGSEPLRIDSALAPGDRPLEAEPEIVFRAGGDDFVSVHLGVEIVRPSSATPFEDGAGAIVADNAAHVLLVVGPEIERAVLDRPEQIAVALNRNDDLVASDRANAVLGDPRRALEWLAREEALAHGEWIASGAMTKSALFGSGDRIVADFGQLGRVEIVRA